MIDVVIIGQGLAGSTLAWTLHRKGQSVMLIDRGEEQTASRIAAGLITPVIGRRMTSPPQYSACFQYAIDFYRRVEFETRTRLLDQKPSVRLFTQDEQWPKDHGEKQGVEFEPVRDSKGVQIGVEMQKAARLRTAEYLNATRIFFAGLNQYREEELDLDRDMVVDERSGMMLLKGQDCRTVVLCQGYEARQSKWFTGLPNAPVKGEILRLKIPGYSEARVVHKTVWILQDTTESSETTYLAGATYDRQNLDNKPTDSGAQEILDAVRSITHQDATITGHFAAVRAGMKRRRPVVGASTLDNRVFIINGLGSRGALMAPVAANALSELLAGRRVEQWMEEVIDVLPFPEGVSKEHAQPERRKSLTQLAHNVLRRIVTSGDTVIDATAGNGHDTMKLAALVGATGHVIGIDVQPEAISQTAARLKDAGLTADLRLADHAVELQQLLAEGIRVKAVMFNLGYRPGSDKTITTSVASTQTALQAASQLLTGGGAITVVAYRGHARGQEEAVAVERWITELRADHFETSRVEGDLDNQTSPVLFIIRRQG